MIRTARTEAGEKPETRGDGYGRTAGPEAAPGTGAPRRLAGAADIALYMDQIISYLPRQLIHFDDSEELTSAMVNNYIKEGLVPRAAGKRYGPIHLGYLTAVCALKKVLSVRDMGILIAAGEARDKTPEELYQYFCAALDLALTDTASSIDPAAPEGGSGPDGPGPGAAQLCGPAGLRPAAGHPPASGGGAPGQRKKVMGSALPPAERVPCGMTIRSRRLCNA